MASDATLLRTHGLNVGHGGSRLVRALDLTIAPGQWWLLVGRNGAGKSTLLRTLAGLHRPAAGEITLGATPLAQLDTPARARCLAYLPQQRADAFGFRAVDVVIAARQHTGLDRWRPHDATADLDAACAALREVDLEALAMRDVRTLSGGERQRVAIAAVLAQDAPLLLLDEPAAALDLAHQRALADILARRVAAGGAVLMSSHDLNAGAPSHALLAMPDGRWLGGSAAEMLTAPMLTRCLGHGVDAIAHGERTIFVPR